MNDDKWVKDAVDYVMAKVKYVIESFGPRPPGSEGECKAQQFVMAELKEHADEIALEPFTVSPKAFMGFVWVSGLFMLASILLYAWCPAAALVCAVLAPATATLEFVFYWQALDPLFPKRTSHNVCAIRRPSGEIKRRIIVTGHVDAAYEMRYNLTGRAVLQGFILYAVAAMAYLLVLNGVHVFLNSIVMARFNLIWHLLEYSQALIIPVCILSFFFSRFDVVSPGANDNLTGAFGAMALFKRLCESGARFDHTEVRCLVTGSEEAGLRGAKNYAKRHDQELKETETMVLVLETLRDIEFLTVYTRDLHGTVRHHAGACALLQTAGEMCGVQLGSASIYVGGSDGVAFTQAGIPTTVLGGMDPAPPRYYHTRLDNWDNMSPECIERSLTVAMRAITLYDEKGIPAKVSA